MKRFRIEVTALACRSARRGQVSVPFAATAALVGVLLLWVNSARAQNWSLTGNAGTVAGKNFVGTTDLSALAIKVHGRRVIRLEPALGNANADFGPNIMEGDRPLRKKTSAKEPLNYGPGSSGLRGG
jgi:hypothetical protein